MDDFFQKSDKTICLDDEDDHEVYTVEIYGFIKCVTTKAGVIPLIDLAKKIIAKDSCDNSEYDSFEGCILLFDWIHNYCIDLIWHHYFGENDPTDDNDPKRKKYKDTYKNDKKFDNIIYISLNEFTGKDKTYNVIDDNFYLNCKNTFGLKITDQLIKLKKQKYNINSVSAETTNETKNNVVDYIINALSIEDFEKSLKSKFLEENGETKNGFSNYNQEEEINMTKNIPEKYLNIRIIDDKIDKKNIKSGHEKEVTICDIKKK